MSVSTPQDGNPPVMILIAKAFQTPDIPRAAQEAETFSKNHQVYVFAWDRYVEYPSREVRGSVEIISYHVGNTKKFVKFGLFFGALLFQIALIVGTMRLCRRLQSRPIVVAHDINTLPVACLLKVLGRTSAMIYDCRELTFALYSEWYNSIIGSFVGIAETYLLHFADAVITVSEGIAHHLKQFGSSATVIYNCPKLSDIPACSTDEARKRLGLPKTDFIISCVATLRYGCGLEVLVEVARRLQGTNVRIVIVGEGPLRPWLETEASNINRNNLSLISRKPKQTALTYVKASNLTWVVYDEGSLNGVVGMPWKLFESIACGIPVIVEPNTLRSRFVEENGCGIILRNTNPNEVANTLSQYSKNTAAYGIIHERTRKLSGQYTWEEESNKLLAVLNQF